ncbi:MAG: hypothetical protein HSCHL_2546 [Hydrogenibacillus schlegelii]|uniref:Uncharacterized protein n=1 Tax=Hydrogenibacillus schlegelii TaxID=1484 RepID=A0A2T5G9P5_HYDSH|nr:MAG: hypothetical protein HSCHL_2546 [Hydrogenibacillus schlegelii]
MRIEAHPPSLLPLFAAQGPPDERPSGPPPAVRTAAEARCRLRKGPAPPAGRSCARRPPHRDVRLRPPGDRLHSHPPPSSPSPSPARTAPVPIRSSRRWPTGLLPRLGRRPRLRTSKMPNFR